MDVCCTPNLELKLILETYVVITSFEENVVYVLGASRDHSVKLLSGALIKL
jgi:hypothetical protein